MLRITPNGLIIIGVGTLVLKLDLEKASSFQNVSVGSESTITGLALIGVEESRDQRLIVALEDKSLLLIPEPFIERGVDKAGSVDDLRGHEKTVEVKTNKRLTGLTTLSLSENGCEKEIMLCCDRAGEIWSYNTVDLAKCVNLGGHPTSVLTSISVNATKCPTLLASSDRNEKVRITRFPQVLDVTNYCMGHTDAVLSVTFCPTLMGDSGRAEYLISVGWDLKLILWSGSDGSIVNCKSLEVPDISSDTERSKVGDGLPYKVVVSPVAVTGSQGVGCVLIKGRSYLQLVHIISTTSTKYELVLASEDILKLSNPPLDMIFDSLGRIIVLLGGSTLTLKVFELSMKDGSLAVTEVTASGAAALNEYCAIHGVAGVFVDMDEGNEAGSHGLMKQNLVKRYNAEENLHAKIEGKRAKAADNRRKFSKKE